jgi:membrane protein
MQAALATKLRNVAGLVKETAASWSEDHAQSMGAALAYYTVFSIAPLLLIVISIAGLLFGVEAARGEIFSELQGLMGEKGARTVQDLLQSVNEPKQGVIATIVGLVTLLVGATTVFGELQDDLDRIWHAPARKAGGGLFKLLRSRLLSFGMILGIGFLLMVSLIASAAISALEKWWGPVFGNWAPLAELINIGFGFAMTTVMFALIYKIMPRVHIDWRDVWIGAAVTALLFSIGKVLIGLYLGRSSVTSGFGAAGSLVVLLLWVYYSAQICLLGAEFTWVFAHRCGSRRGVERPRGADADSVEAPEAPAPPA